MSTKIFVNLPVHDVSASIEFFAALGYPHDPRLTDENATCVVLDEGRYVMLLAEPFFKNFTQREIVDATKGTETILCLGVDSREQVDLLADKALAAGGQQGHFAADEEYMYGRSFQDLDGHLWEVMWMDMAAMGDQD